MHIFFIPNNETRPYGLNVRNFFTLIFLYDCEQSRKSSVFEEYWVVIFWRIHILNYGLLNYIINNESAISSKTYMQGLLLRAQRQEAFNEV